MPKGARKARSFTGGGRTCGREWGMGAKAFGHVK